MGVAPEESAVVAELQLDAAGIGTGRVAVDRESVHAAGADRREGLGVVAEAGGRGGHSRHQDLVAPVAGQGLDLVADLAEAARVALGGDLLGRALVAGPLHGQVGLVADDPDVGPGRVRDEVRHALRERVVVPLVGQRAVRAVAVIEPDQHAEAAVRPRAVAASGRVGRVVPQLLGEQDPALPALVGHVALAARLVHAEDVGRLAVGLGEGRHRPRGKEQAQEREDGGPALHGSSPYGRANTPPHGARMCAPCTSDSEQDPGPGPRDR